MILQKNFSTQLFADYYKTCQTGSHSIKLVVDDISFDVNKFILNCWSEEFGIRADDDHEIFLPEFNRHKSEIKLCVDLLHGKEIQAEITNIAVILKFAAMFKVTDMINIVMEWFQDNITLKSFLEICCIINDLNKMGLKFDQLFVIIRQFIEQNTEPCIKMLSDNFVEDVRFVIDMLMCDGACFEKCISLFISEIRKDAEYHYLLDKIEQVSSNNDTVLVEQSMVLNRLMDKAVEEINNLVLLKKYMRFRRNIPADNGSGKNVVTFQSWRRFSKRELLDLQSNTDLKEYQYAAICVYWIQEHKPEQDVVLEVYNSIKQEKLQYNFVYRIRQTLHTTLQYNNIPALQKLPVYEYEDQTWSISRQ